jgi:hypothetical protein
MDHTCVNNIKRIAREAHIFKLPVACTETHNSIVPMCVELEKLRDGETLYYPFAKKMVEVKHRKEGGGKVEVNHQSACRYCGKLFEASRGVIIHESMCKSAPTSRNSNADQQRHLQHDLYPFFLIIIFLLLIIFLFYLQT